MYRCQICGAVAPAGTRANKIILSSRTKVYPARGSKYPSRRFRGGRQPKSDFDKGGEGHEIARELMACERCAESHKEKQSVHACQ